MLIADAVKRKEKHETNRTNILNFLLLHRYSSLKNIAYELRHKSSATSSRILKKLCYEGLVRKETLQDEHTKVVLFGITKKGIDATDNFIDDHQPFQKGSVSLRTINHTLVNQRVMSAYSRRFKGSEVVNTEFGNLKKYEKIIKFNHRPDGVIFYKIDDRLEAIILETELSLKDRKRYWKIWYEYVQGIKESKVFAVAYVMKNEAAVKRIETIFNKLKYDLCRNREEITKLEERFFFSSLEDIL
ncbi:Mobilization protein [Vibrio crassostreae]|nr:Mobilization protein [Vibrio crassostreae]